MYRSRAGRHFYGTENDSLAGFGLVGNTEKVWADFGQKQKFESSAFAFVCFEIPTLLNLEISTLLKLEISSFRRVENFKLQKG